MRMSMYCLISRINTKESLDDTDLSITPTNNTPISPPIEIPLRTVNPLDDNLLFRIRNYNFKPLMDEPMLSPISGSFDLESPRDSPFVFGKLSVCSGLGDKSRPQSATNELPLTKINLALFTELESRQNVKASSTNELPLSDIKFKSRSCRLLKQDTIDSQNDDVSLEVNLETDFDMYKREQKFSLHRRSFSDPNILKAEWINSSDKHFLLEKYNESLSRESNSNRLSPAELPNFPYSFYPGHDKDTTCLLCAPRHNSNLLSFYTSRRSLSHPANPCVINPCVSYSECGQAIKRHRHSIAGQMSYFKVMGLSYGMPGLKKLVGGSTNSLFSTAVISGSSSAPNLRDMISSSASASAIEGFGGVPPIRPLETLHNALSLKQIDTFLDHMTTAQLYRTPSSTPPKYPSTPLPTPTSSCVGDYGNLQEKAGTLKLQSPNNSVGWSGPPSFMSSSGPSSPGLSDTNSKESSEMSSSIISADGLNLDEFAKIFPTAPGLDNDLGRVGMTLDTVDKEISGSIEFSEYYASIHRPQAESGEITPISYGSEVEFNTNDATAGSSSAPEFDYTITEDIDKDDMEITDNNETLTSAAHKTFINNTLRSGLPEHFGSGSSTPLLISPSTANITFCSNDLKSGEKDQRKNISNIKRAHSLYTRKTEVESIDIRNFVKDISKFEKDVSTSNPNVNMVNEGYLKWNSSKEKFFDISKEFDKNINKRGSKKIEKDSEFMKKSAIGTKALKESYIEPPNLSRVPKILHENSSTSTSYLDVSPVTRRASDAPATCKILNEYYSNTITECGYSNTEFDCKSRPQFITQMSQPCGESSRCSGKFQRKASLSETISKNPRFITIRVDEAEHAASVGISKQNKSTNNEPSEFDNT